MRRPFESGGKCVGYSDRRKAADPFYLQDGSALWTLQDLQQTIAVMDDGFYRFYANERKNDFAHWIEHAFGLHNLARAIRYKGRAAAAETLQQYLQEPQQDEVEPSDSVSSELASIERQIEEAEDDLGEKEQQGRRQAIPPLILEDPIRRTSELVRFDEEEEAGRHAEEAPEPADDRLGRRLSYFNSKVKEIGTQVDAQHTLLEKKDQEIAEMRSAMERQQKEIENYKRNLQRMVDENQRITEAYLKHRGSEERAGRLEEEAQEKIRRASGLYDRLSAMLKDRTIIEEVNRSEQEKERSIEREERRIESGIGEETVAGHDRAGKEEERDEMAGIERENLNELARLEEEITRLSRKMDNDWEKYEGKLFAAKRHALMSGGKQR